MQADGTVVDAAGNIVGVVTEDGSVLDLEGNVIGTTDGVGIDSIAIGDCAAEIFAGESIPVDIFVMFDQSGSMVQEDDQGTARIDAVRSAVSEFLTDPASLGLAVGIGNFGKQPLGEVSCDPANYSTPDVGIARLPANTPAIIQSLSQVVPTGETPTGAAIRAYVIGVGPSLGNLDQIANAGDTGDAYLVEGGDVASEMLRALNEVRGSAEIPCEFTVPAAPSGESLDFGEVNAIYTTPEGETEQLFYVESVDGCEPGTGGWYYDDADAPKRILLCESTCTEVERPGGRFSVALGCETVTRIR